MTDDTQKNKPFKVDLGESIARQLADNRTSEATTTEHQKPSQGENRVAFTREYLEHGLRVAARKVRG